MMQQLSAWDRRFIDMAILVSSWSKDPSTKVGAVVVNDHNQVLSVGFNGFPRGVFDFEDRYTNRETKLLFVAHAEQNALDSCFVDAKGTTIYTTLSPCFHCAKSIIQRGVKRVIAPQPSAERLRSSGLHLDVALKMFGEAGVECLFVEDGHKFAALTK